MSFTALDMLSVRKEMTRLGFPDDVIRDTIRARMNPPKVNRTPVRPAVSRVRSAVVERITPQLRTDRQLVDGYRMPPTFCGMCADHHPIGQHTL